MKTVRKIEIGAASLAGCQVLLILLWAFRIVGMPWWVALLPFELVAFVAIVIGALCSIAWHLSSDGGPDSEFTRKDSAGRM